MVRVSDPGGLGPAESETSAFSSKGRDPAVKLEMEDELEEEEFGQPLKRSRPSAPPFHQEFQKQWSNAAAAAVAISSQPSQYNPQNEPSPLGLRLRKSPSLLDLIQMKLSQGNVTTSWGTVRGSLEPGKKKDGRPASVSGPSDKLKASNFPASLLKIGTWECISRYEGDLVAKCYYAKHKLVWEVLDGGLKSKIEIQWSDITALKASCPDNEPGTLDVVLARQPLFFRETNPQPRKHTLWQATSDFTGGQASIHRRHFLQCPQGLLSKHFEKLIQCDPRLNSLSRQPDIVLDSPYFEPRCSLFDDQEETKCHGFDHMKNDYGPTFSGFHEASSTCSAPSTSSKSDIKDPIGRTPESALRDTPSPSSALDSHNTDEISSWRGEDPNDISRWDQIQVPGMHPSMSMSDLVNHIGNCITEQRTSGNPIFTDTSLSNKDVLEEITQYLLGDSQLSAASDENSLMSRVNSLCCLLQKDPATVQTRQKIKDDRDGGDYGGGEAVPSCKRKSVLEFATVEGNSNDVSPRRQPPAMSRKESVGDLLLHLPRIASLPQFLFNISEESKTRAR